MLSVQTRCWLLHFWMAGNSNQGLSSLFLEMYERVDPEADKPRCHKTVKHTASTLVPSQTSSWKSPFLIKENQDIDPQ